MSGFAPLLDSTTGRSSPWYAADGRALTTANSTSLFRTTFAKVFSGGVDSDYFNVLALGAGAAVSQSAGNLVITSGTTTNSEIILRSVVPFNWWLDTRWQTILSQRIVNQAFYVELVDVIGDRLAFTINSATSVTVTIPNNPFTYANVGQSMNIGAISGAAGVGGRYAIASVGSNTVTFTVAGWPASGSGVCSLFGWNYARCEYSGATATSALYDTQRRGWNTGNTTATINTTASPGHMGIMLLEEGSAAFIDQLVASATTLQTTLRASRVANLPDETANLYLQIRMQNGTVAPASTTTWTIGMASVADYRSANVTLNSVRPQMLEGALQVALTAGAASIGNIGTVTTVTTVASVTAANLNFPQIIADVASAALTTTTTTAAFTPTFGISYQVNIPVTAVTGTTPTLDVSIEESDDGGTNWYKVYDFPRITTTGIYRSPDIPLIGNRVRYVQTVGGSTPSFTRAINRLQSSYPAFVQRQLVDRSVSLTTLNSVTPTILARDAGNATQLIISVGAITTTAPALQLEGSDDFGLTWYAIGSPLTAVANSTVQQTVLDINSAALRARVSTAGVGVTANYVMIKAHD